MALALATLWPRAGRAQSLPTGDAGSATAQATPDPAVERIRVRLAMSKAAAERLSDLRVRRLLGLELDDVAEVEPTSVGTLEGDDLIRVWIDVPMPRRAIIEVRRVDGSFARRALEIGDFPSDVAAEAVALAASEMVRVQERVVKTPAPAPAPEKPRSPTLGGSFAVGGNVSALLLPGSEPLLFIGPELGIDLRHGVFGHRLYGRWQVGPGDEPARWLEIGAGADFRFPLSPEWRVHLGVSAGFVHLALPEARAIDREATTHDWTVRVAGAAGIEARIAHGTWLALSIEPGAALRPLDVDYIDGRTDEIGGFAFGINLGLRASPFEDDDDG